jgi:hypothetical protein
MIGIQIEDIFRSNQENLIISKVNMNFKASEIMREKLHIKNQFIKTIK